MPLEEIDQAELQKLRLHTALLDKIGGNAKTRSKLLEIIKELNPAAVIPEVDAKHEVMGEVAKTRDELAALRKQLDEEKAQTAKARAQTAMETTIEAGRARLKADGFTQEGIEAVEKLMETRGIADYDAAAALYERTQPKEDSVTPTDFGKSWNFMKPEDKDEEHKLLLSDPMQFQQKQIRKFMAEARTGNGGRR